MPPFQEHKFKREEHVYVNNAFSELLKDAVRFFNGTPVLSLPLENTFKGAGVYAIYCIAKKGLYKTYGEKINRLGYYVPIYVGKAEPTKKRKSLGDNLSEHFDTFKNLINKSKCFSMRDFRIRFIEECNYREYRELYEFLKITYDPLWNRLIFNGLFEKSMKQWYLYHTSVNLTTENLLARKKLKLYMESINV